MRRTHLGWTVGLTLLLAQSCRDSALAPTSPERGSRLVVGAAGSDPTVEIPLGVGGSYTLLPRGGYFNQGGVVDYVGDPFTDVLSWRIDPPLPTGIVLPVGAPVRVVGTGVVSITGTPAFVAFCATFPGLFLACDLPVMHNGQLAAWGLDTYAHLGQLFAAWGPVGERFSPADSSVVLAQGLVGADAAGELYIGRDACCFGYTFTGDGPVPFQSFSGRHVVTVQPEDGSDSLFLNPKVWLEAAATRPAPGGPVTATIHTADGATPTNITWYYIPDVLSIFDGNSPMAAAAVRAGRTSRGADIGPWVVTLTDEGQWRILDATTGAPAARGHLGMTSGATPRSGPATPMAATALTAPAPMAACTEQLTCTVTVAPAGSFFVVLELSDGATYSASNNRPQAAPTERVRIRFPIGIADTVAPQALGTNTVELLVDVLDSFGLPVGNRTITLTVDGIEGTGGHDHGGVMPAGSLSPTQVTIESAGVAAHVVYTADVFAGLVELKATAAGAAAAIETVTVAVKDLAQLAGSEALGLVGVCVTHTACHAGTNNMLVALHTVADSFHAKFGRPLEVNDISLPLGGKFDLAAAYGRGGYHDEHRDGRSADVRTHGADPLTAEQRDFIWARWEVLGGTVHDETILGNGQPNTESPHYHFRF